MKETILHFKQEAEDEYFNIFRGLYLIYTNKIKL